MSRVEEELHIRQHTSLYGNLQDDFGGDLCEGQGEVDFAKGKPRLSGFLFITRNCTALKVFLQVLKISYTLTTFVLKFVPNRLQAIQYMSIHATCYVV
jgi:hypothetical protein